MQLNCKTPFMHIYKVRYEQHCQYFNTAVCTELIRIFRQL